MSNYDTLNISAYIIEFKGCHWAIFVFKRGDPWKVKEITSDIRFMDFKSYMWIKLSQEEKWFAKISSLAQVTDKKNSKIARGGGLIVPAQVWRLWEGAEMSEVVKKCTRCYYQ